MRGLWRRGASWLAALVLGAGVLTFIPDGAEAAADVRVLRTGLESRFPQAVVFHLEAAVLRPIQKVTISYRVQGRLALTVADAQVAQGQGTLRAEGAIDLNRRYLPPGTTVQFYWHVVDDRGESFKSDTFQANLEDPRFQWRHTRVQNVDVYWNRGGDDFGRALASIVVRAIGQLGRDAGVRVERPVRIFVYGDAEEFRSSSFRGGLEWVGGTYYARENVVLIYAPPTQQGIEIARRAIPHELTHVVVHQVTDNPYGEAPQWLNEGLASRAEPRMSPDQADALARAIATDTLMSLRALGGAFPVDSEEALVAYAASYSAVSYIVERYGSQRLNALLQVYREGVTHDQALQQALGLDQAELDREWRAWLMPWPMMKTTPFPVAAAGDGGGKGSTGPGIVDRLREWVGG